MTIILTVAIGLISILLFRFASGTLEFGKLNIVSFSFYLILLQVYAGCFLVTCGFNKHYTLSYLVDKGSIEVTNSFIWVLMLLLPLTMLAMYRIFKFDSKKEYNSYLNKEIAEKDDKVIFWLLVLVVVCQLCCLLFLVIKIGYVPFTKLFHHEIDFNFGLERSRIQKIYILKSSQLTNLIVKFGIPLVSYITAAYAVVNRKISWILLAGVTFIMGITVKTMDFSKSPLAFYFLVFVFILIYARKGGIKRRYIIIFGCLMFALLMFYYRVEGYSGKFTDIYNGILGRTLFTQYGTLTYHFDMFPDTFDFLGGRSLYPTILKIIGMDPTLHLRSAKLVMAFYGIEKVYDGTAGVMNTVFLGEAYANWGPIGAYLSIIWVGIYVAAFFMIFCRIKKTPVSIALFAFFTFTIGSMMQSGFVDFIYSSSMIITIFIGVVLLYYREILNKISGIVKKKK